MDVLRRENETCYWGIQDDALNEGIKIEWGCGNNFLLYATNTLKKLDSDTVSKLYPCNPVLYDIHWNKSLYNSITRKLVNESHGLFLNLQNLCQQESDNGRKQQLVKISQKYRSILAECVFNLENASESATTEAEKKEYESQVEMFYTIQLIWNLCEILFIDIMQPGLILQQLLQWVQYHFPEDKSIYTEILEYETPENHPSFWNTVYKNLLLGKLEDARKTLKMHSMSSQNSFRIIDELLKKIPLFKSPLNQSIIEVGFRWCHWQEECKKLLVSGEFSTQPNLETLCKILCGDKSTFEDLRHLNGSWYNMMVSRIFYSHPCSITNSLADIAKDCIDICIGTNSMQQLDIILLAVIEYDLSQVIRECCALNDNWWFVTHLTDLLYHCGHLEQLNYGTRLREFHLLNYASSLMSHNSLWQIGVDYFDHCSELGRQHLEMHLERIPLTNYAKAQKVLNIARKRDMQSLINSICKVMGMQALKNKQLGTALCWSVQSKDINFVSYLADRFLVEYVNTGKFTSLDLLDNLGSYMLVSDKLTFLGKYREFHKLYQEKNFVSAATLLVSLLSSKLVPKHFYVTLLLDSLPLLESKEISFSSNQINELLHCLEDITESQKSERNIEEVENLKEKLNLLRLALARNLSRTSIREGSCLFP